MKALSKDDFIHEYNHFRNFGFSDEQIADRLGVTMKYFSRRVRALGIRRPPVYEVRAVAVLDRLIASGEGFTAEALPCTADENLAAALLGANRSRLRVVGERKSALDRHGKRVRVYVGAAA